MTPPRNDPGVVINLTRDAPKEQSNHARTRTRRHLQQLPSRPQATRLDDHGLRTNTTRPHTHDQPRPPNVAAPRNEPQLDAAPRYLPEQLLTSPRPRRSHHTGLHAGTDDPSRRVATRTDTPAPTRIARRDQLAHCPQHHRQRVTAGTENANARTSAITDQQFFPSPPLYPKPARRRAFCIERSNPTRSDHTWSTVNASRPPTTWKQRPSTNNRYSEWRSAPTSKTASHQDRGTRSRRHVPPWPNIRGAPSSSGAAASRTQWKIGPCKNSNCEQPQV